MKDNSKKEQRKFIIRAAALAFAMVFTVYFLSAWLTVLLRKKIDTRVVDPSIRFSSVDYDADIFADPRYVNKERNITWTEGEITILIGENCTGETWHGIADEWYYRVKGEDRVFFRNFIICLISGDYENYPSFFTNNFFRYYTIPEKFTAQQLYDISVEVLNRTPLSDGSIKSDYILRYKIMNNNGTYRGDVASDKIRPLVVSTITRGDVVRIEAIAFLEGVKPDGK